MSEGYDTSSLFDGIPMTDAVRNDLNHRVRMHVRSLRLETLAISDTNNELAAQLSSSQARLSEAVKVLEEIISACDEVILFQGEQVTGHILKNAIDRSKARQFLATIGEEK